MTINIVGAGLAGLLAANMLYRHKPVIFEKQASLPNNHSAVLRFRSNVIAETISIPFKQVRMMKATAGWRNHVADTLAYSYKNLDVSRSDRSIKEGFVYEDRYIAPPDLILRMADGINIMYGADFLFTPRGIAPVISTIPMPILMQALSYPSIPEFKHLSGMNIKAKIGKCDAYVSLMVPDPDVPFSRISITGDELIIETNVQGNYNTNDHLSTACKMLGLAPYRISEITVTSQRYAKILPIDDKLRKSFIHWATENFGIFSLGRFATWRPGLLLDDLVHDVKLIEKWITQDDRYGRALKK